MFTTSDIGWVVGHSYIVYGAAHQRLDDDHVRGPADPARSRDLVEDRRREQGEDDVQLADRDPRAEEAGPGVHEAARPVVAQVPVPRRRAARRADRALGGRLAGRADRRQLLADRDRLADPVGAAGRRGDAAQVRQPVVPGVRLRRAAAARRHRRRGRRRREGRADDHAAAAAGLHDDGLGRRRALRQDVLLRLSDQARVLDVRLGDARRRRLLLRARPHRRRDQRRRPPARHARDRGGRAGACGHRRSRRGRRRRSAQGPGAGRVRGRQGPGAVATPPRAWRRCARK